ncbi:hypothetical protein D3C81_2142290 [compost metagenome]
MRGQHQLDVQASQLPGQRLRAMPLGSQPRQQFGQYARLERCRLRLLTAVNQLILLGDIRQIEELVERPRHG